MKLAHKIELAVRPAQARYFRQACGTDRFTWNWAKAEWDRQYAAGERPTARSVRAAFNQVKYAQYPWLEGIHRDAHARAFDDLGQAWINFFEGRAEKPKFKKKGKSRDTFYVANDKFTLTEDAVRLPIIGWLKLKEAPRFGVTDKDQFRKRLKNFRGKLLEPAFTGAKILGATVSREADRWFIAIQYDVEAVFLPKEDRRLRIGVDTGLKNALTGSDGQKRDAPKPLKRNLRRLQIRQRDLSRKIQMARARFEQTRTDLMKRGIDFSCLHLADFFGSNIRKDIAALAKLHAHIKHIRKDFLHKETTRLCRENQVVVIEDLFVKGMMQWETLALALSDVGLGMFKEMMERKEAKWDAVVIFADRFFPSSKKCSTPGCHYVYHDLTLKEREWTCPECGAHHDRDENASLNLERYPDIPTEVWRSWGGLPTGGGPESYAGQ